MDSSIRERVLQLSPWQSDPSAWEQELRRHLPKRLVPRSCDTSGIEDPRRAKLIVGPRQAGKSTLVWSLLAERLPAEVLFLLGEEERVRAWCGSPAAFLADLEEGFPEVRTVFLDEAQHLDEAGLFVKGLVDGRRGLDVIVTGSGAFHLEARTRESLAGRAVRRRLLPFSVDEIVAFEAPAAPAARRQRRRDVMRRQMVLGGYPGVWLHERPLDELRELVESFVLRDASDRFRIERPEAFRRVLQLAAGQCGQMANLSEWAGLCGIAASTVSDYLSILEETWVVAQVPPFAEGRRREITHARRIHFYDTGLRNILLAATDADLERRADRGALLETFVFGEIQKALPLDAVVLYWRAKGGAEVDFVVRRGERLVAVEVKWRDPGRPSRSLKSFADAYRPHRALVACGSAEARREEDLSGVQVSYVPAEDVASEILEALADA